jgi:hypothetical protein
MAPDEYTKALDKAVADLEAKLLQRDLLNAQIIGDKETVRILSSRITLSPERQTKVAQLMALVDSATPTLTDAIRSLLTRIHPADMTAVEVRNRLEEMPSFEEANISLSACHAALKRLLSDGEVRLGKAPRNGKATYCRVLKMEPPPVFGLPDGYSSLVNLSALAGLDPDKLKQAAHNIHPAENVSPDPARKLMEGARFPKAPRPPNFKK